ncbi:MAG TPA: hypothetical protein VE619_11030, partial [Nitrososphaeraceae archaeon]|nr:hypothetical protein [Nitrososphaeraceae archaeon]
MLFIYSILSWILPACLRTITSATKKDGVVGLTQLEIDECIRWIKHSIDFDKNFSYNYASAEDWEFLVFGA